MVTNTKPAEKETSMRIRYPARNKIKVITATLDIFILDFFDKIADLPIETLRKFLK